MARAGSNHDEAGGSFRGIIPPLITPLLEEESLDGEALGALVEFLLAEGVHGVFVMGTSGEAMSVTDAVWRSAVRETIRLVRGRVPVLCGVIDSCTSRVIQRIRAAEELGARVVVVTPGFYLQANSQEEIQRHFEAVCRATSLAVAAYNIPSMTHVNILPETIRRLVELDNLVMYKESAGSWEQFQRCLFLLEGSRVALFNGAEELCAASMLFGAGGCVPGLANFFPRLFIDLYEAARNGRIRQAYELQKRVWQVRRVLYVGTSWMSAMKYLGRKMGFGSERAAAPTEPLTAEQKGEIDRILEKAGAGTRAGLGHGP